MSGEEAGKEVGSSNMPVVAAIVEGGRGGTVGLEMSVGGGGWRLGGDGRDEVKPSRSQE